MKGLPRILQIIWMIVGSVCFFEAYSSYISNNKDINTVYLFSGLTLFAFFRYFMLRRKDFMKRKKDGKFD
jgi:lysozyme family protein